MSNTPDAREKLRAKVNGWKAEKVEKDMAEKKEVEQSLVSISNNAELADLYKESAKVGAENLGSSLPMLKIHTLNKSKGNVLADGKQPNDGWFFYSKTQEQFETVTCSILTISRGFRAEGMADPKTGIKRQNVFNQILGGVIMNDDNPRPFIIYFTGSKLSRLWDFAKEAGKYTNAKPIPVPMFALTVVLKRSQVENDFGFANVIDFEILKDEKGFPIVITDPGKFVFLRDMVDGVSTTIDSLISSKATEDDAMKRYDSQGREIEDIPFPDEPR